MVMMMMMSQFTSSAQVLQENDYGRFFANECYPKIYGSQKLDIIEFSGQ